MAKAKSLGQANFVGQEIEGDDLTADFDPLQHEHAQTDLGELDRMIEDDIVRGISEEEQTERRRFEPDEPSEVEKQAAQEAPDEEPEEEPTEDQEDAESEEAEKPPEDKPEEVEQPAVEEPPPVDERLSALERQLERERLEREKQAADSDKWRLVAERESARAGNLQQKLRSDARPQSDELYDSVHDDDRQAHQQQRQETQQPSETQALMEELNVRAIQDEQQTFLGTVGQFLETLKDQNGAADAFSKDLQDGILSHKEELQEAAMRGRPRAAARMAKNIFTSVLAEARLRHMDRQDAMARELKAKQKTVLRSKKQAASGSPGKSSGKASTKPKFDPMMEDLDKFDAELDRAYGTNKDAGFEII